MGEVELLQVEVEFEGEVACFQQVEVAEVLPPWEFLLMRFNWKSTGGFKG